jgi:glyoxylase-like metal-dependent hydrolase (beta-lactamase superfamily II)/tetratricopeptide (TPR) repeat protein
MAALATQALDWKGDRDGALYKLGLRLAARRDIGAPHTLGPDTKKDKEQASRAELLRERTRVRRKRARQWLGPRDRHGVGEPGPPDLDSDAIADRAWRLLYRTNLTHTGELQEFAILAFVDAHLSTHAVESRLSIPLRDHFERGDAFSTGEPDHPELERCIRLNTFVFAVARALPWIFAESDDEAGNLIDDYEHCWKHMVPSVCTWIPTQLSLLALHHRGQCHRLAGRRSDAYNDFHKLERLVREAERRSSRGPQHAAGSEEFLDGLRGLASYQIGELYRGDHAHLSARRHFERSRAGFDPVLEQGGDPEMKRVVRNSRWYADLLLGHGKTAYELGRFQLSLDLYLRSWRELLMIAAKDAGTEVGVEAIGAAIAWLDTAWPAPELVKPDAIQILKPVVKQLDGLTVPQHLTALAADILLRLGHLLFVIRLGTDPAEFGDLGLEKLAELADDETETDLVRARARRALSVRVDPDTLANDDIRDRMALRCLKRALECDPTNTLVISDLLKIKYRRTTAERRAGREPARQFQSKEYNLDSADIPWVDGQMPPGGDDFDRVSRLIEYLELRALTDDESEERRRDPATRWITRDLLANFFVHTDSISVRKSQLHEYLLRPPQAPPRLDDKLPFLELVSMRRYSSIYPFFPRPSAFQVRGGGYFVRVYPDVPEDDVVRPKTFGIAIDPGPSFVENLYRCGYGIADVDMVIVTHDHPDHMASLDPLLSLAYAREVFRSLEAKPDPGGEFNRAEKHLVLMGNASVAKRYEWFGVRRNRHLVDLSSGDDWRAQLHAKREEANREDEAPLVPPWDEIVPADLRIETVPTGHLDLDDSQALALRIAIGDDGPAIGFTSDTPKNQGATARFKKILQTDVCVAHVSSVPLSELRELAQFAPPKQDLHDQEERFKLMWSEFEQANRPLTKKLEYASWIAPGEHPVGSLKDPWMAVFGNKDPDHLYLEGTLRLARRFNSSTTAGSKDGGKGIFVVGELSEELGTFRSKIATQLNQRLLSGAGARTRALSGDIGLKISVRGDPATRAKLGGPEVRVLCTTCDLDNDLIAEESYHGPDEIVEVCIKGENEGIFYNCLGHDPEHQEEPRFVERLERYDVFGR